MRPKVEAVDAACEFARTPGRRAVTGSLAEIDLLVAGTTGTMFTTEATGIEFSGVVATN